jgi:phosphoglucosamine mutase
VALLAQDLGVVLSASHNPPEYNGVKFFDHEGHKLPDSVEEEIEALLGAPGPGGGQIEESSGAADSYLEHVLDRFGTDLGGLRVAVDCANGAFSEIAPRAFERLGAEVTLLAASPDGTNINDGCGATDLAMLQDTVRAGGHHLGIAFDGDGDRIMAVDETGAVVDGDPIIAVIAIDQKVDQVAVTVMTNLGFHRLMADHGITVHTTDVGDRYVLEALRREGGILGGEQSGHVIWLDGHVTGDGLAAGLLLCAALRGRPLSEVAGAMPVYPQVKENVRVTGRASVPAAVAAEVERRNGELAGRGRILVRPSGTEPLIRVLVEAASLTEATELCGTVADRIRQELGREPGTTA